MAERLIDSIDLYRLTNGEQQRFHETLIAALDSTKVQNFADIKPEIAEYRAAYRVIDDSQIRITKSEYTAELFEADKNRDTIFREMRNLAAFKGSNFKASEAEKKASVRIGIVFDRYKNAPDESYETESSMLTNLDQQLTGDSKADVELLGLGDYVTELRRLNEEVKKLTALRVSQMSGKNDISLKTARLKADFAYKVLASRLDSEIIVTRGKNYAVAECIRLFNGTIRNYNGSIAKRSGGKLGSKTKTWSPFYYGETPVYNDEAADFDDSDTDTDTGHQNQVKPWDANEDYTKMSIGDKRRTSDGRIWEAIDLGQVHRDPTGEFGHFGWREVN